VGTEEVAMTAVLGCVLLASAGVGYIHVPPATLQAMTADSSRVRVFTVRDRDADKGVVVFDVAEVLRDADKGGAKRFRLAVRPEVERRADILAKLAAGATAVLFSREHGEGAKAGGYGYLFLDDLAVSVDYNGPGEVWLGLRAEPTLSKVYHGPAAGLAPLVKGVLAGKPVTVPTRPPDRADDHGLRALRIDEARRRNDPSYPKTPLPTAWGKPAGGLQAGVRVNPAVEWPGAAVVVEVVVRNVDAKPRVFNHLQLAFGGSAAGGTVTGRGEEMTGRNVARGARLVVYVSPGDAYVVATAPVFRPGGGKGWAYPRLTLEPGENRVGMERVLVRPGEEKGADVELATGYLDVTLPPATR
jgi:hypothetical protein